MFFNEEAIWKHVDGLEGLHRRLEEIEKSLIADRVPIEHRQVKAFDIIVDGTTCNVPLSGSFAEAIANWYRVRYGDRTNLNTRIGSIAVLIRGAPYQVDFPLTYGRVEFNPLELVKGATDSLLNDLNEDELMSLAKLIGSHYQGMLQSGFLKDGIDHLDTAVEHVMRQSFGLCRWECLMSVEKAMKQEIKKRGGTPHKGSKGHDLRALNQQLQDVGRTSLDVNDLDVVQCSASMRYNEVPVTLDEAIAAIHSASRLREVISNS